MKTVDEILNFWYPEKNKYQKFWFSKTTTIDNNIKDLFEENILKLTFYNEEIMDYEINEEELNKYDSYYGKIALIILCDQMVRNIYRNNDIKINFYHNIAFDTSLQLINSFDHEQQYFIFILICLRHKKDFNNLIKVIDLINIYERTDLIENRELWMRFKINSYRDFLKCNSYFTKKNTLINDFNFKEKIMEHNEILDSNVKIDNWNMIAEPSEKIIKSIDESIKRLDPDNDFYCVSLSGGVDSMVIVHALWNILNNEGLDKKVIAVHIEHSNREESKIEEKCINDYCSRLGIIYHTIKISHIIRSSYNESEIDDYYRVSRDTYEDEVRRIRFNFYKTIKDYYGASLFSLGHHNDDLIENIIANTMKGRDILDLPVLKEHQIQDGIELWRPLLDHPKKDILDYAEKYGIPYVYNSTPKDCMRGRMRNELIPLINEIFPNYDININNIAKQSRNIEKYFLEHIINPVINTLCSGKLGFYFDISIIKNVPENIFITCLTRIFHKLGKKMLKRNFINEILKKIDNEYFIINNCIKYDNKLIFLDDKYFIKQNKEIINESGIIIEYEHCKIYIEDNNSKIRKKFNLNEFITGKFSYTIDKNYDVILSTTICKKLKNYIASMCMNPKLINKYPWITSEKIEDHNLLITYIFD